MADYLGVADPDEVILTSGTTLGINLFAHAFGARLVRATRSCCRSSSTTATSCLAAAVRAAPAPTIRVLPVTDEGRLDPTLEIVTERCKVIAVTHASNVTGALADLLRIVAAAQAVGAGAGRWRAARRTPLDVPGLGVDAYAISGHKMFGPTGGGALWVRATCWPSCRRSWAAAR